MSLAQLGTVSACTGIRGRLRGRNEGVGEER